METQIKQKNKISLRRLIFLAAGNILIALGISLFAAAAFGSDPHSAMVLSIAGKIQTTFGPVFYALSGLYFIFEFLFGRHLIGIGTFFNWFLTGWFTDFFQGVLGSLFPEPTLLLRTLFLISGLLIISLGISLYQTADLGVGPYDSLALILDDKTPVPYFWCRIFCDGTCALVAILLGSLGSLISFGSIISAFGLGPFISFFNRYSEKLIGEK